MAQTYNKLKIDIKEPVTDIITAKQNDSNSRFLDVYLYDGSTPIDLTGHEVRIYMRKPDKMEVFNNGEITDAMYQEVKEFAALIKLREAMKKQKE